MTKNQSPSSTTQNISRRVNAKNVLSCLSLLNSGRTKTVCPDEKDENWALEAQLTLDLSRLPKGLTVTRTTLERVLRVLKASGASKADQACLRLCFSGRQVTTVVVTMPWNLYCASGVLCAILETCLNFDPSRGSHEGFADKVLVEDIYKFFDIIGDYPHTAAGASATISYLKYVTALWYARFSNEPGQNDLPKPPARPDGRPVWGLGLSGTFRKYIIRRIVTKSSRNAKFLYSLLQCKRGAPPVPECFVDETYDKHLATLCLCPRPTLDFDLRMKIREKVNEVLRTFRKFNRDDIKGFTPSRSATISHSRRKGGAFQACWEQWECEEGLIAMVEVKPGQVVEVRGDIIPTFVRRSQCILWSGRDPLHNHCKVHGICEPLKVRTITKSSGPNYNFVKGLQRYMWSNLVRHRQFSLIGKTVEWEDVEEIVKDAQIGPVFNEGTCIGYDRGLRPGQGFVSGDYSGATDSLNIEVTKTIFECIMEKVEHDGSRFMTKEQIDLYGDVARGALYEHTIHYPNMLKSEDRRRERAGDLTQKNGQLMGSILSFPILCLANLVCYWLSLKPDTPFGDLPVRVNGDDILFSTDAQGYEVWKRGLEPFGFKMSIGKNYFNRRYLIINSELFDSYREVALPYYQAGLLMGRSRVGKELDYEDCEDEATQPLTTVSLVLNGAWSRPMALSRFIFWHREEWLKQTLGGRLSPWLPHSVGGLGLDPSGLSYTVTPWQRKYATYVAMHGGKGCGYKTDLTNVVLDRVEPTYYPGAKLENVKYRKGPDSSPIFSTIERCKSLQRSKPDSWLIPSVAEQRKFVSLRESELRQILHCPEMGGDLSDGVTYVGTHTGGCIEGDKIVTRSKRCRPNDVLNNSVPSLLETIKSLIRDYEESDNLEEDLSIHACAYPNNWESPSSVLVDFGGTLESTDLWEEDVESLRQTVDRLHDLYSMRCTVAGGTNHAAQPGTPSLC